MKLTDVQKKKIAEDFPREALSVDDSRGFVLTSIKAMFVIERLNDVFGIIGWSYSFSEPQEKGGEYFCKVTLNILNETREIAHSISQYGGKRVVREHFTDALKSSITDGLTKCASILGIGHKVFKGEVKLNGQTSQQEKKPDVRKISEPQQKRLFAISKKCGVDNDALKLFLKAEYGIENTADILRSDYEQICNWVELPQQEPKQEDVRNIDTLEAPF